MNKVKYFAHDNDASEDEWMHELIREFGPAGYGRYWIIVENYDRHRKGEKWTTSWSFVREKLRSRSGEVRKLLGFFSASSKVLAEEDGEKLIISIPKFIEKQAKLRSKFYSTLRQPDPNLTIDRIEGDGIGIKDLGTSRSSVPKKKRKTATAPAKGPFKEFADRYFAYKFKDQTSPGAITSLYSRYGKALKDIIAFSDGDVDVAVKGTFALEEYFNREKLSFTLDTIAKRFAEWKADSTPFEEKKKPINLFDHFLAEAEAKKNGK